MENLTELELRIMRTVQLLLQMKDAIAWHKAQERPSLLSIRNYTELKSRLEKELLDLLATELDIQIPVVAAKAA